MILYIFFSVDLLGTRSNEKSFQRTRFQLFPGEWMFMRASISKTFCICSKEMHKMHAYTHFQTYSYVCHRVIAKLSRAWEKKMHIYVVFFTSVKYYSNAVFFSTLYIIIIIIQNFMEFLTMNFQYDNIDNI